LIINGKLTSQFYYNLHSQVLRDAGGNLSISINLGAAATIGTVGALRETLIEALGRGAVVTLDADDLADVDLAFIQLIEAARKQAVLEGKVLRLSAPANPALTALLDRAGFISGATPEDVDFWFHGEAAL
jgi:anti-anti-sigma regulatory factor